MKGGFRLRNVDEADERQPLTRARTLTPVGEESDKKSSVEKEAGVVGLLREG